MYTHSDISGDGRPVASEKEPALRLLLGSDAVFLAGVNAAARAEEDAKWKALSVSTDFDGLVDFSETPVAPCSSRRGHELLADLWIGSTRLVLDGDADPGFLERRHR